MASWKKNRKSYYNFFNSKGLIKSFLLSFFFGHSDEPKFVSSVVLDGAAYTPQIVIHVIAPHLNPTETFWELLWVGQEPTLKVWAEEKDLPFLGIAWPQAIIIHVELSL
jgi:hypothetical protein